MTPRNRDRDPQPWPIDPNATRAEGERRKDAALVLLESRRECYIRQGRRALLVKLLRDGVATADDVRAAVELPPGLDPKAFGAVPKMLASAGIIRADGFVRTARAEGHARPVTRWRLVDARAAEAWLKTHPPLAELKTAADLAADQQSETPPAATDGASITPTTEG
jgi:hypothetical protein